MKIIVVGATGTIGKALVEELEPLHDVVKVGFSRGDYHVDITQKDSIEKMYERVGDFDAVISTTGDARFGRIEDLNDTDFEYSLQNKLLGQINLFVVGKKYAKDNTSFTLTSGVLAHEPRIATSIVSMVNAGLEAYVKAASLELKDIRLNIVSPVFAKETMEMMGVDSSTGVPAIKFARAYEESLNSSKNGEVLDVREYLEA